jgi:hypothetical protein
LFCFEESMYIYLFINDLVFSIKNVIKINIYKNSNYLYRVENKSVSLVKIQKPPFIIHVFFLQKYIILLLALFFK